MSKIFARAAIFAILMIYSVSAHAQNVEVAGAPGFGGPNAVENKMAEDRESWNDWKKTSKTITDLAPVAVALAKQRPAGTRFLIKHVEIRTCRKIVVFY